MLRTMGCEKSWCKWIRECIGYVSLSILTNGSPSKKFKTMLFQRAREANLIKGVQIGDSNMIISHLQFADGTFMIWRRY